MKKKTGIKRFYLIYSGDGHNSEWMVYDSFISQIYARCTCKPYADEIVLALNMLYKEKDLYKKNT